MPTVGNILSATIGILILLTLLALFVISPIVAAMKGKYGLVFLGLLVHPCWAFGAIRLAKPDSYWARRFYGPDKINRAQVRFTPGSLMTPTHEK